MSKTACKVWQLEMLDVRARARVRVQRVEVEHGGGGVHNGKLFLKTSQRFFGAVHSVDDTQEYGQICVRFVVLRCSTYEHVVGQ